MIFSINGQLFDSNFLEHHGIKGQKWGIRRYQNSDGTWTELGKQMRQNNMSPEKAAKAEAEVKMLRRWDSAYFDPDHNETDKQMKRVFEKVRRDIFDWYEHGTNGEDDTRTHTPEMDRLVRQMDKLERQYFDLRDDLREKAWQDVEKKHGSPDDWKKFYKVYKQLYKQYGLPRLGNKVEAAKRNIDAQVLKELGFEVTEESMDHIRTVWEWD